MYVRKHLKITYLWILYSNTQSSKGKYQLKKSLACGISNSGNVWNGYNGLHKILQGKLAFIYCDIIEKHLHVYPKWISQISFKNRMYGNVLHELGGFIKSINEEDWKI